MARTAEQDEELNRLYEERSKIEEGIINSLGVFDDRLFKDFPGWVELDNQIEAIVNLPQGISEEERLKNILQSCDEQLEKEPTNQWWAKYRLQAQERLEEIYQADHPPQCECNPGTAVCNCIPMDEGEMVF